MEELEDCRSCRLFIPYMEVESSVYRGFFGASPAIFFNAQRKMTSTGNKGSNEMRMFK